MDINANYIIIFITFIAFIFITIIIYLNIPKKKKFICGKCGYKLKTLKWWTEGNTNPLYIQKFQCSNKKCKEEYIYKEKVIL